MAEKNWPEQAEWKIFRNSTKLSIKMILLKQTQKTDSYTENTLSFKRIEAIETE